MARGKRQDVWEFFGELLKERREAAGLSRGDLGGRVFVSGGHIGLFEQGIRKPQLDVAKRIDEILQTGGIFERTWRKLMEFADQPPTGYTETSFSGTLLDGSAVVKRARRAYDPLRVAALSPEAPLKPIESAAEDFRRCASTT
ncbi:Scr1 family TA system antitoxin-like transcriptional regulator [Streptomyces sp. NPDC058861]|uniref:helix-turn-helix domain-containing protein n=1 Tax=Streptomyces sp. NPDC058861 TaxID=3346653 RepID=UPI0036A77711